MSGDKIPALNVEGKFVYNKYTKEYETYDVSKALEAYKEGYAVYIDDPLDEDMDCRMFSAEDITDADGHLFVFKEVIVE